MMGHKREGAKAHYPILPKTIVRLYRKIYPALTINHQTRGDQRSRERDEPFTLMVEFMLKANPGFVEAFEKMRGLTPGTIRGLIEGGMTGQQLVRQLLG